MASELVENSREFVGDIAAPGDHDPLWHLLEPEHFVRSDRMLDSRDCGQERARPGGDQYLARADRLAARQPDRGRPRQRCALAENLDVMIAQRLPVKPLEPIDFGEDIVAQHGPVEALGRNVPAEHRGVVEILGEMRTIDEQFLGHAAADHAGPADSKFLGDRDLGAMPGRDPRRAHPARPGADHEQVIIAQSLASSIKARVDASNCSRASGSSALRAISLPSSTPNWSNGLVPTSIALAKVRCS